MATATGERYDELRNRLGFVPQEDVVHRVLRSGRRWLRRSAPVPARCRPRAAKRRDRAGTRGFGHRGRGGAGDQPPFGWSASARCRGDGARDEALAAVSGRADLRTRPGQRAEPDDDAPQARRCRPHRYHRHARHGERATVRSTVDPRFRGRMAYFGPSRLAAAAFGCDDLQEVFGVLNAEPERGDRTECRGAQCLLRAPCRGARQAVNCDLCYDQSTTAPVAHVSCGFAPMHRRSPTAIAHMTPSVESRMPRATRINRRLLLSIRGGWSHAGRNPSHPLCGGVVLLVRARGWQSLSLMTDCVSVVVGRGTGSGLTGRCSLLSPTR